jgi:hypothetical protein
VNWAVEDPKKDTKMFKNFPRSLLSKLERENVAFHAHDWVIDIKTYEESQQLSSFFNILATDEFSGTKFVMAMEAKRYPISGVMFHPETQQLRVFGDDKNALRGRVNNDTTDAINFYFSYWVNESAKKNINSHKFKDPAAALKTTLKNTPKSLTNIYSSQTLTFGFYS